MHLCHCLFLLVSFYFARGELVNVEIVDRHNSETGYNYTLPQTISTTSNTGVNCISYPNSANCAATTRTTGTVTPPRQISYSVQGATFSLRTEDGKIVVVNCDSKYRPRGDHINRRSCRMPLVKSGRRADLTYQICRRPGVLRIARRGCRCLQEVDLSCGIAPGIGRTRA